MLYIIAEWLHFPGIVNLDRYPSFPPGPALMPSPCIRLVHRPPLLPPPR